MRIAVFGANGKTGRLFVAAALVDGHQVIANIHTHNSLTEHASLTIVRGDAQDTSVVDSIIRDADAVVSFVGHGFRAPTHMQTAIISNIVTSMATYRVARLVSLTGTGVRMKGDLIPAFDHAINWAVEAVDPNRINDGRDHVQVLKASSINWTVLRVLKLSDIPPRAFVLREHGPTKLITSRHEVVTATLDLLESNQFIRKAPIIGR